MKTIAIGKSDARRLGLPAGVQVQIQPCKKQFWEKAHDVYYNGVYKGTTNLDQPNGAGR